MICDVSDTVAFRGRPAQNVSCEPLHTDQKLPFPVQGLAVHAAQLVVYHTPNAAPGKLQLSSVGQGQCRRQRILGNRKRSSRHFRQEAYGNTGVFPSHQLAAVQAMVFQLLPAHRRRFQLHHPVVPPYPGNAGGKGRRVFISLSGQIGFSHGDTSIRFPAKTGKEIIPVQIRFVQRLTVIPVFDIQVDQICLFSPIERKVVFSMDPDLRQGIAFIELQPVIPVIVVFPGRLPII